MVKPIGGEVNVNKVIKELDKNLAQKDLNYTLYICGGAQLIFLGYTNRRTEDVDLIHDKIDKNLKLAAKQVAKKLDLEENWLNNKVSSLGTRLGRGWKRKTVLLFNGEALTLMGLDRQHLISTKLHAAVDRKGEDYQDLLFLKPTKSEINIAEKYVLKQNQNMESAAVFIKAWVKELKNDLGIN